MSAIIKVLACIAGAVLLVFISTLIICASRADRLEDDELEQ